MATFRPMTLHAAELLKGALPIVGPIIDHQAPINATQNNTITGGYVPKGRIVSLNTSGEWVLGVGATNATLSVPWFLMSNSDDPDVITGGGGNPASDYGAYVPGTPSGKMNAVCLMDVHVLQTTEFVGGVDYPVNTALSAPLTADGTAADLKNNAGVLTKTISAAAVTPYKHAIVGYVLFKYLNATPDKMTKNAHGRRVLTFVSSFLPKLDTSTTINYN